MAGGLQLGFIAQPVAGVTPTAADMTDIVTVLKARAAAAGVVGATFTIQGPDTVIVELPGVTESEPVAMLLGHTGNVAFVPLGADPATEGDVLDPSTFPPLLSGDAIASAAVGTDQNGGPAIDLVLTAAGAEIVRRLHGRQYRLVLRDHHGRHRPDRTGHPERDP